MSDLPRVPIGNSDTGNVGYRLAKPIWYRGELYVRRSGSPGCPDHRVQVDAQVTFSIPAEWPNRQDKRDAAKRAAEQAFRKLGLGTAMDLEGARVTIDVVLL